MICKNCGTEGKGKFCAHCGVKLRPDTASVSSPPAPISAETIKKARRLPPLSLKMVFWQSIALLLPLVYLFFDIFILLPDSLFCYSASGSMYLHRFLDRLTDLAYETNTMAEITELTIGRSEALFYAISPHSLFFASDAVAVSASIVLPMLVIVALALLCAASGVLLLLTGGRILRVRAFCNLTLISGVGAVFAPLLASWLLRLQYCFNGGLAAADIQMQHVLLSLEAICVMGILVCVLLPALSSLRRLAAYSRKEREFVCFPYRFLTRSFKTAKLTLVLCMIGFAALVGCFLCLPMTTTATKQGVGEVLQSIGKDFEVVIAALKDIFAKNSGASAVENAGVVLDFAGRIWILFVLLLAFSAFFSLLRTLFIKKDGLLKKKRKQRAVKKAATAIRNTVFAPFILFFAAQTFLCLALLLFSPIVMHFDFSHVSDTLSVIYLTVANLRTLGTTNTLYTLLAACGFLLWHMADGATAALIVRADKEQKSA